LARTSVRFVVSVLIALPGTWLSARQSSPAPSPAPLPGETRLANLQQLTFGGENAEAYFSPDGRRLVYQSTRDAASCDQIYTMNVDGSDNHRLSSGEGRTTCGFYEPDGRHLVYASTHLGGKVCPPRPDFSRGYVWPIYDSYDIFRVAADGSNLTRLTTTPGYDAEATIAPDGRIVFTSVRDGDMDLYLMNADGSGVRRLTNRPGPDGGPFFSRDGSLIVWRGKAITDSKELQEYRSLLREELWRPTDLEIFVMRSDGSDVRQVTNLGGSSFAPYIHPDNRRIIFASNQADPKGRNFDLYLINIDGTGLERVTFNDTFDGFPMFSPDGRRLVFGSNRNNVKPTDTNVFIADWIER
jgi:Tol biopolymer transport system component